MKTKILALSVAAVVAVSSFTANAALPDTWTIGVRGGAAHATLSADKNPFDPSLGFGVFRMDTDVDRDGWGVGAFVDYNVNEWFGVEVGFNYFDGFSAEYTKPYYGHIKEDISLYGPEVAARLTWTFDKDGSDLYARVGAAALMLDNGDGHDSAISPFLGVGVQYNFNKYFGARIGYDYYYNVSSNSFDDGFEGMHFVYAGLVFTFGHSDPVAPAPAAPNKVRITETHSLQAGALFPFDGSILSDEGKQAVADVVNSSKRLENTTFEVYGYTDRIGSDAYNQTLSDKRANAVASELVKDGVSPAIVQGRGKANPVTGDKCNNVRGRQAVIDCLAPDRRVDIHVSGETTETQN